MELPLTSRPEHNYTTYITLVKNKSHENEDTYISILPRISALACVE